MAEIVGREVLLKDENGEVIVPYVGYASQGRNIGDIFYTSRLDTELNGAFECNGGTYSTSDFTGSQSIDNLLSSGKLPYVSLAEYESIVSSNGSCRVFGWDGGDSFRVPTIPAILLTKEQAGVVGNGLNIGLTTGGDFTFTLTSSNSSEADARYATNTVGLPTGTGGSSAGNFGSIKGVGVTTDPTKSGIVANLDTIQYRAMVQLAISTTDDAVITATSALQQIANKVDKNSSTDRETVVNWGMPDYSAVVSITSPFTVPKAGIVIIEHSWSRSQQMTYVNGHCFIVQNNGSSSGQQSAGAVIVNAGDEITTTATWLEAVFVPMKGVN